MSSRSTPASSAPPPMKRGLTTLPRTPRNIATPITTAGIPAIITTNQAKGRQEQSRCPHPTGLTFTQVLLTHPQREPHHPGETGEGIGNWYHHRHVHGYPAPVRSFVRVVPPFRAVSSATIQAGIPALAGITYGSCQPEKPTHQTHQLMYRCPLSPAFQVAPAELVATDEAADGIRDITEQDQQVEADHQQ